MFDGDRLNYQEADCKKWRKYESINSYKDGGCQNMFECQYSHGWKEYDYHFNVYKTRKCN